MKRYLIEEVRSALKEDYGPLPGAFAVSVRYDDGEGQRWLSAVECCGCVEFHLSDEDISSTLVAYEPTEKVRKVIEQTFVDEIDGFPLGDYGDLYGAMEEDPQNPAVPLMRYLVLLVRCPMVDLQGFIDMGVGRHIDEVDLPDPENMN